MVEPASTDGRLGAAFEVRRKAAEHSRRRGTAAPRVNGDEERIPGLIACYSKGLPHDKKGEPDSKAYDVLLKALRSGRNEDFERIPLGGFVKLANPQSALAFRADRSRRLPGRPAATSSPAASKIATGPVIASPDGLSLVPWKGSGLTVGGELDKLAGNIAYGRNFAGLHWRSDAVEGLRLGEAVAVSVLEEMRFTGNDGVCHLPGRLAERAWSVLPWSMETRSPWCPTSASSHASSSRSSRREHASSRRLVCACRTSMALHRGKSTEMYSFDHDLGHFVSIGPATVSEDGMAIASNPGVGILKAGWHCGGDPALAGTAADCPSCTVCDGSQCVGCACR